MDGNTSTGPAGTTPFVVDSRALGDDPIAWAGAHRGEVSRLLSIHGALLFRDLATTEEAFSRFIEATSDGWATYREPSTPRRAVGRNLFTSTEYPADQPIVLHNENSHCTSWPLKIYFLCVQPASSGGQTPIADCRKVLGALRPDTVQEFAERRIRYVRHFGGMLGFRWQTVFGTDDRARVEEYCRREAMEPTWSEGGALTVSYVREPVHVHPVTGERVWFNHGFFFNPASFAPEVRDLLLEQVPEEGLPYNTRYGDGGPIAQETWSEIREAYAEHTARFDWVRGDVLLLDNMLMAHGRCAFTGERRILVGLADTWPRGALGG